jgi:hypothetical protein
MHDVLFDGIRRGVPPAVGRTPGGTDVERPAGSRPPAEGEAGVPAGSV